MAERVYLTVGEVLQIHSRQIENYGGPHGIRDIALLESSVFRPQMESLANKHPFLDGNKRVAFAAAHTFLLVNGCDLQVHPLAAYEFVAQSISTGKFRFGPILGWINHHIRPNN